MAVVGNRFALKGTTITLTIVDPKTETQREVVMDFTIASHYLQALSTHGIDRATEIARAAFQLAGLSWTAQDVDNARGALEALKNGLSVWENLEEFLYLNSFAMVESRRWTHAQAAEVASAFLGEEITPDAWRMRVKRWSEKQKQPTKVNNLA